MRRATAVLGALLVGAALWALWGSGEGGDTPRWVVAAVDRGPITATVTATGTVNPVETVQVGTYVSGPIQEIHADFNTPVTKGQLLARIDPRPFALKVDAAEADLANAQAQLVKARADRELKAHTLRRSRQLHGGGIVSDSDLDTAESDSQQATAQIALQEASVRSAQAKLNEARVNLAYADIVAPVDGVVVSRSVSVGQTVAASFQTPTLFLVAADLTRMEVEASVSESDIGTVTVGQDVLFSVDAYPQEQFKGRVAQVRNAPVTVQNVVTYSVLVAVDNTSLRLKPGMTANVTIVTATRPDAVRVPSSALRFRPPATVAGAANATPSAVPVTAGAPSHSTVWRLGDGDRLVPAEVKTGISDDRFTEIVGGLDEGARVVTAIARDPKADTAVPQLPLMGGGGPRHRR